MSSFKSLPTLPKSDGENPDHQSLEDYISYPKKLQQRLSNKIANDIAADLIANSQSERTAARLRSVQGRGAGGGHTHPVLEIIFSSYSDISPAK